MKILYISPQPFFRERGTPLRVALQTMRRERVGSILVTATSLCRQTATWEANVSRRTSAEPVDM